MELIPKIGVKKSNDELLADIGRQVAKGIEKVCADFGEDGSTSGCSCLRQGKVYPFSSCIVWMPLLYPVAMGSVQLKDADQLYTVLYSVAVACRTPAFELNDYLLAFIQHEIGEHKGGAKKDKFSEAWLSIEEICKKLAKRDTT
ncbi:MAG: hypothetical protein ABH829_03610 [archaeon]